MGTDLQHRTSAHDASVAGARLARTRRVEPITREAHAQEQAARTLVHPLVGAVGYARHVFPLAVVGDVQLVDSYRPGRTLLRQRWAASLHDARDQARPRHRAAD